MLSRFLVRIWAGRTGLAGRTGRGCRVGRADRMGSTGCGTASHHISDILNEDHHMLLQLFSQLHLCNNL